MTAHNVIPMSALSTIGGEPRLRDLEIAERLGMRDQHKIRSLIESNLRELAMHGEVSARRAETSPRGGRPGREYWLNEAQALLICMFSRTPRAAEVRRQVIELFIAWRRGQLAGPGGQAGDEDLPPEAIRRINRRAYAEAMAGFGAIRERMIDEALGRRREETGAGGLQASGSRALVPFAGAGCRKPPPDRPAPRIAVHGPGPAPGHRRLGAVVVRIASDGTAVIVRVDRGRIRGRCGAQIRESHILEFLRDRARFRADLKAPASWLHDEYQTWCLDRGREFVSRAVFDRLMTLATGLVGAPHLGMTFFLGVDLREDP